MARGARGQGWAESEGGGGTREGRLTPNIKLSFSFDVFGDSSQPFVQMAVRSSRILETKIGCRCKRDAASILQHHSEKHKKITGNRRMHDSTQGMHPSTHATQLPYTPDSWLIVESRSASKTACSASILFFARLTSLSRTLASSSRWCEYD